MAIEDQALDMGVCICCCEEHTFPTCPGRLWGGCRSGLSYGERDPYDASAWQEFYAEVHGMSAADFFGRTSEDQGG